MTDNVEPCDVDDSLHERPRLQQTIDYVDAVIDRGLYQPVSIAARPAMDGRGVEIHVRPL